MTHDEELKEIREKIKVLEISVKALELEKAFHETVYKKVKRDLEKIWNR